MENQVKKRYISFDVIKVISISKIFLHHIMMDLYIVHPMYNLWFIEFLGIRPNENFGMVACSLFILISGATLFMTDKNENLLTFYRKRFIRVIIPFYISYMICFCIRVFNVRSLNIYPPYANPLSFIFTIIGVDEYLSANGVVTYSLGVGEWFLGCILLCYLFYPLLVKCHRKNKFVTFLVMTIYYIAINQYLASPYSIFKIPSHMNFLSQFYNFYLGVFLIDKDVLKHFNKKWLFVTIPIILFLILYPTIIPICDNYKTSIYIVCAFISFYSLEDIFASSNIIIKITSFVTAISLEIYLVHHFIIYEVDYLLNYRPLRWYQAFLVILFDAIATLLVATFVNRVSLMIIKKINFIFNKKNFK